MRSTIRRARRAATPWPEWVFRRATVTFRALPDFVIVGASKCGTTSLYGALGRHPAIARARHKEVQYFSLDANFAKGVRWYRAHFPFRRPGRITGEATPQYLAFPEAPRRMAATIPRARLIALVRHPVDRAYSQYQHAVHEGFERRSFEAAIAHQLEVPQDATGWVTSYLSRGYYLPQLENVLRVFPREQLLVICTEDCFRQPAEALATVLAFLGVSGSPPEMRGRPQAHPPMAPGMRVRLLEHFRPHNQRLYAWLGRDLGWNA